MGSAVTEFLTPKVIHVEELGSTRAKIVLEPLERGFGHTLGNALRRILLSSMPGCAVTDVEIDGVQHEYSSIEGVREDVIEIMLNLKGVAVVMGAKDVAQLSLSAAALLVYFQLAQGGVAGRPDALCAIGRGEVVLDEVGNRLRPGAIDQRAVQGGEAAAAFKIARCRRRCVARVVAGKGW